MVVKPGKIVEIELRSQLREALERIEVLLPAEAGARLKLEHMRGEMAQLAAEKDRKLEHIHAQARMQTCRHASNHATYGGMHTRTQAHTHASKQARMHARTRMHMFMHACTHLYARAHMYVRMCKLTYTCAHECAYARMHARTRARTHTRARTSMHARTKARR